MKITAIHFRKLSAVTEMKMRTLMSKNFIIMPIFSLGFTFLMKILYRSIADGKINMDGFALSLGVLMNISMSVYCTAAALAEEKEKNTLRTLMTSSVNGLEFFLGSIIPVIILSTAVNVLCVFIVQLTLSGSQWGAYLIITTVCTFIASVVGMIFGIYAKTQVSASTITTPALIIFMMVPMLSGFSSILEKISNLLFTGIALNAISAISAGKAPIHLSGIIVLSVEAFLSAALFLILYRKNGFEK